MSAGLSKIYGFSVRSASKEISWQTALIRQEKIILLQWKDKAVSPGCRFHRLSPAVVSARRGQRKKQLCTEKAEAATQRQFPQIIMDGYACPARAKKKINFALKRQKRQPSGSFRRLLWAVTPARRGPRIHYIIKQENLLQ